MNFRIVLVIVFLNTSLTFSQLSFSDSATSLGVGFSYGESTYGGGVSFCDFDNDGWDDLTYSTTNGEKVYFFKNNAGTFEAQDFGINHTTRTKQVLWVDYDNDGDKDFMATSISDQNKYYRNEGGMVFTDVTNTIGFFTENLFTYGISFGDIDADGDLDAFICNRDDALVQRNYLYRNDNGFFVDITVAAGIVTNSELSFCSAFFDYDNDGDQDIYVANDKLPHKNRLYQNDGLGNFTDVSVSSGAGITIDAMSTTIDDYNNDGWFDIYVSNTHDGNYHLRNNGDGTFTNVASLVGTTFESIGWGCVFLDADNDADLDLYVSGSIDASNTEFLHAAFYENNGSGIYTIPTNIGFENDSRISFSNAIGDINNDGFPDITVMNDTENYFLWENTTTNTNNWLKVKLIGVDSNRDGIGSVIEISIAGNKQYRYTLCGEGYLSQNSNTEFFGLSTATQIDYVKVTWSYGTVDIYENVTSNQVLTIVEGSSLSTNENDFSSLSIYPNPSNGIIYINGLQSHASVKLYDVSGSEIIKRNINPNSNSITCEYFPNGVYFMHIESNGNKEIRRIVVK